MVGYTVLLRPLMKLIPLVFLLRWSVDRDKDINVHIYMKD